MIIDSRIGGFGDVWMRLLALYTLTGPENGKKHTMLIRPELTPLARRLFGERIDVADEGEGDVIYTHLGLRHLIDGIARGNHYVLPFYWVMRTNRKTTTLKHRLNDALIPATARAGLVRLTDPAKVTDYQGYTELSALDPFRDVSFGEFRLHAAGDLRELQLRLHQLHAGVVPGNHHTVVFPSGTSHQVMPPEWAEKNLRDAVFAFHQRDPYAREFESRGLKVERFGSPEEMLALGLGARRIICTDSFPSHFWQVHTTNVLLLLAQQTRSFIVHPGFPESQILASRAPCCPCLHRERNLGLAPCDMGHLSCLTWQDPSYQTAFEKMLSE